MCRLPDEARPQQLHAAPQIDMQGWCRFYRQDGYFGSHAYKHGSARILHAMLLCEISLAAGQQRLTVSPVDVREKRLIDCIVLPLNYFSSQEDTALLSFTAV